MTFFRVVNNLFRFNRTNWKAVSLCFIAATVFWFFNALNKDYASNVRFKLQFEFDRKKFVQAKSLPSEVFVNVSGNGWDLLRKYFGFKLPAVIIPLERPVETKKIVGSTLPPLLASQLGNLKINHILTDTLYITIEPKDSIKMQIAINAQKISFKEGYGRTSPIVILPDSVQLDGPRSSIKTLNGSVTLALAERRVSSNFRETIEIPLPDGESVRRNPPVVEVMFEVGEVIEVPEKIRLNLIHIPRATHTIQDRDSVECLIQIPKNRVDDFTQYLQAIKAEVDLKDARIGGRKEIPTVSGLPPYASLVRADSVRIKVF